MSFVVPETSDEPLVFFDPKGRSKRRDDPIDFTFCIADMMQIDFHSKLKVLQLQEMFGDDALPRCSVQRNPLGLNSQLRQIGHLTEESGEGHRRIVALTREFRQRRHSIQLVFVIVDVPQFQRERFQRGRVLVEQREIADQTLRSLNDQMSNRAGDDRRRNEMVVIVEGDAEVQVGQLRQTPDFVHQA